MKKLSAIFGTPDFGKEEERAVLKVLRSKWVGFGKESIAFEEEVRRHIGAAAGAVVSSCTAALHLALIVHEVEPGDEIITTPLTFAATANVMLYMGAKPVFVDIDPQTLNINPANIERAITKRTKGIMVVHFGGLPCDMRRIQAIAKKHGLFVVEDAAHAFGAVCNGKQVGNTGNLACFSFYANKNLASAEGGFLSSNDKALIERAKVLRLQGLGGSAWKRFSDKTILTSQAVTLGYKYNMTDIQAAIGRAQLKKFDRNQKRRHAYAKIYDGILRNVPGIRLQEKPMDARTVHALHLYTVVIDPARFSGTRDELVMKLREKGIFAVVHYHPLHLHPYYRETFGFKEGDFPHAEAAGLHILTLPLLPQFTAAEAKRIAKTAREVFLAHVR